MNSCHKQGKVAVSFERQEKGVKITLRENVPYLTLYACLKDGPPQHHRWNVFITNERESFKHLKNNEDYPFSLQHPNQKSLKNTFQSDLYK